MMFPGKKLIVYELNEVPRRVLDLHVAAQPGGALKRILDAGTYADTHAEDSGILSPWVTWPTVHRGVTNDRHCISEFGQDLSEVDREYPPIWRLLAERGVRVGVFGSLHSYPPPGDPSGYEFYVPDTFAAGSETFPEALEAFQAFNLAMVDASARNVNSSIALASALRLLRDAPAIGVRAATFVRLAVQLVHERLEPMRRVRRRTAQVQLAFDLFIKQLRAKQPSYATFFTNHVASSMHRYWPATFPEDYRAKQLPEDWKRSFRDEIAFTMRESDRQLGILLDFVDRHPAYALAVMTSMGQAAVDDTEIVRTQLYIADRARFMQRMGVEPHQWSARRAMLPRYVFQIDPAVSGGFADRIAGLEVNGKPVEVASYSSNVFAVKMGQVNLDESAIEVRARGRAVDWRDLGLENQVIEDATGSYAYHVPEGVLLVYDPARARAERVAERVPTHEIAAMTLRNFDLPVPAYMA